MAQPKQVVEEFTRGSLGHSEGKLTKAIEQQTAKVPSATYLTVALASMAVSAGLAFLADKKPIANFIGLWVPTILLMGIYNKLVKLEGSDKYSHS